MEGILVNVKGFWDHSQEPLLLPHQDLGVIQCVAVIYVKGFSDRSQEPLLLPNQDLGVIQCVVVISG